MAEEKKTEEVKKTWDEMTFRELTREALIQHAESLADDDPEKALEAMAYLDDLLQTEPVTAEMKREKRRELESKTKKKRDKESGQLIDTDKPLYTKKQIDKMIDEMQGTPVNNIFYIKQQYCERYYPEILKNVKKKKETPQDLLAAARARVKAKMK